MLFVRRKTSGGLSFGLTERRVDRYLLYYIHSHTEEMKNIYFILLLYNTYRIGILLRNNNNNHIKILRRKNNNNNYYYY